MRNLITKYLGEAVKYDENKMKRLIAKDKFLGKMAKETNNLKVLFNTYVVGDSVLEKIYDEI